jgi:WD40 repeat protein
MSSEAGNLYWWSLYGERKDMEMFYGPSTPGESILAMYADATNRYLICDDTRGEIHIWNIEDYCCLTTSPVLFDSTTSPVLFDSTASPVLFDSTTPPFVHSWQGHLSPIILCECTDYKGDGSFILTGSTDHTARLWTINGEEIGIFGQRQERDIELLLSSRGTNDDE